MTTTDPIREAFEKMVIASPYEKSVDRFPDEPAAFAWPGNYKDISTQLAWEAWQAALEQTEEMVLMPREPEDKHLKAMAESVGTGLEPMYDLMYFSDEDQVCEGLRAAYRAAIKASEGE